MPVTTTNSSAAKRPTAGSPSTPATKRIRGSQIDLGKVVQVTGLLIENRPGERRTEGLSLSLSEDARRWARIWAAAKWEQVWEVPLTRRPLKPAPDCPDVPPGFLRLETRPAKARAHAAPAGGRLRKVKRADLLDPQFTFAIVTYGTRIPEFFALVSRIYGLIPVPGVFPTCDTGLFP